MKKYKLIKNYPGSPKIGYIAQEHEFTYMEEFVEFWEEVVEAEYQILSIKPSNENNWLSEWIPSNKINVENMLYAGECVESGDYYINSVKRLSDGEIFTIGDTINNKYIIDRFELFKISYDVLVYLKNRHTSNGNCLPLKTIFHSDNILFTTEDGVDIFEGDECWGIIDTYPWKVYKVNTKCDLDWIHKLTFSTLEAAKEYINSRKPYLSNKDVLDEIEKCTNIQQLKKVFTNKVAY